MLNIKYKCVCFFIRKTEKIILSNLILGVFNVFNIHVSFETLDSI